MRLPAFCAATASAALLLAGCSAPSSGPPQGTHFFCYGTTVRDGSPTLVVSGLSYPFAGTADQFRDAAPALGANFAAYAASTWQGMAIVGTCIAGSSEATAEQARNGMIGSYEGQSYAIMRSSYWQPPATP
jgi:hypothetical protein